MPSGLINKANVVPGNVHDSRTVGGVCPDGGALYGDKEFCGKTPDREARRRSCSPRFIKRNNMKEKNKDLDWYLTKIRAPYERVFSKENKKARYLGIRKNLFAELMNALTFNCKRLLMIRNQILGNFVISAG